MVSGGWAGISAHAGMREALRRVRFSDPGWLPAGPDVGDAAGVDHN